MKKKKLTLNQFVPLFFAWILIHWEPINEYGGNRWIPTHTRIKMNVTEFVFKDELAKERCIEIASMFQNINRYDFYQCVDIKDAELRLLIPK